MFAVTQSAPNDLRNGLIPPKIFNIIKHHHPKRETLQQNQLNQALERVTSVQAKHKLQPLILDFSNNELYVVDANFLVFLTTHTENELLNILKGEKILNLENNLVSLTLTFSKDFLHTPGVIFNVVRNIAGQRIMLALKGFDGRFQLAWDEDIARAIHVAVKGDFHGAFNLAGEGTIDPQIMAKTMGIPLLTVPYNLAYWMMKVLFPLGLSPLLRMDRVHAISNYCQLGKGTEGA
jgi:hypothetical protein